MITMLNTNWKNGKMEKWREKNNPTFKYSNIPNFQYSILITNRYF